MSDPSSADRRADRKGGYPSGDAPLEPPIAPTGPAPGAQHKAAYEPNPKHKKHNEPLPLLTEEVTPTCRVNRGDDGAWDEAVRVLKQVYDAQVKRFGPTATLHLTISRGIAPGVYPPAYYAAGGWEAGK